LFYKDTTGLFIFKTYFLAFRFSSKGALIEIFFGALSSETGMSIINNPLSIVAVKLVKSNLAATFQAKSKDRLAIPF
jgi:hypothetical protein